MKHIKYYTEEEAKAIVAADENLSIWAERLRKEDEDNGLDYGIDCLDFCTNIDDESENRVWIDWFEVSDTERFNEQSIVGLSIEQAILIARDIVKAKGKIKA
jgi:hypothetical protein